jgi:succinate-semialdehyde dehydrogenase/glutarate-semialdehyde dehydrogenase
VHQAIDEGAHLEFGSAENDGAYFEATILTDIPQGASVRYEEFFGPVAQFYKVSSEQEAVELANDTPYGLGSYIFSADYEQALRVADALEAGMTYINEAGADSAELPFGGVKNSGFGREMGPLGITEFVNMKLVTSPKNSAF